jgi:hypothetical protein
MLPGNGVNGLGCLLGERGLDRGFRTVVAALAGLDCDDLPVKLLKRFETIKS